MSYALVLLNVLLFALLAPFFEGVIRRVTARVQSRKGPPLLQPYFDVLKLLGKENLDSAGTWPFRTSMRCSMNSLSCCRNTSVSRTTGTAALAMMSAST